MNGRRAPHRGGDRLAACRLVAIGRGEAYINGGRQRCPGHGGTSTTRVQALGVSGRRSRTTAGRQVRRSFNPLIPLLAPWVSVVVVDELLPEAGGIVKHQLDARTQLADFQKYRCGPAIVRVHRARGQAVLSRARSSSTAGTRRCLGSWGPARAVVDAFTGTMAIHSLHLIKLLRLVGLWV